MKQILVAGMNELAQYYIDVIQTYSNMKIIAIIETERTIKASSFHDIPIYQDVTAIDVERIDYIFSCEPDQNDDKWKEVLSYSPIIFNRTQLNSLKPFVESFILQFQYTKLILNNMRDGIVTIDANGIIQFMNNAAKTMLHISSDVNTLVPVNDLIPDSRLLKVLQHQEKEVNERLELTNGKKVVSTRIPLTNHQQHLIGAFAVFKDSGEIVRIAEENTDLKEMKAMLEAIFHASTDPICMVDEHACIRMVNSAYTRMIGLSEKGIIGEPIASDFAGEASIHKRVLETRRPVIGTTLEFGPSKKEAIVNASPIIVQGKLKGSVAVICDNSEFNQLTKALTQTKKMIRHLEATNTFDDIVGKSADMKIALEQAKIGCQTSMPVLLRGDSGTGKKLFARAIHKESTRKYHQFIQVNCSIIKEDALERKLFGVEHKGTTDANIGGKKGLFEEARKGSIFLDGIDALSLYMQTRLLNALKEQAITRVGGTAPIPLDIRMIAATNENLEKAITAGTFEVELYYRLSRFPIYIPSLKERMEDIPKLIDQIMTEMNHLYGKNATTVSDRAMKILLRYHWPKNMDELKNVISHAIIFMKPREGVMDVHHLPDLSQSRYSSAANTMKSNKTLQQATKEFEKEFILRVYKEKEFNKAKTSEALGISVRNLYYKLEKYDGQTSK